MIIKENPLLERVSVFLSVTPSGFNDFNTMIDNELVNCIIDGLVAKTVTKISISDKTPCCQIESKITKKGAGIAPAPHSLPGKGTWSTFLEGKGLGRHGRKGSLVGLRCLVGLNGVVRPSEKG